MSDMEKFRALGISEATIAALSKKGFEEPSPIQAAAIPLLLQGEKDVIGQAQTGTGKTAAFGIPIIEKIRNKTGCVQALILTPTRELAIQIAEELNTLKGEKELAIIPVYGGQAIDIQLRHLRRGVDIVVGTPGRIMDLMRRGALIISEISFAVLDEADEMLNMGFVEDIETILAETGKEKSMLMFSATMPPPIMNIARKFMREYEIVRVKQRQMTADLTAQIYFEVRRENKFEALTRIIDMEGDFYALVFCRTKNDVDELAGKLQNRGYVTEALHGDISQSQRIKVIEKFKRRQFNVLIATDVAARGIDINNLTHVINYSIPQDAESYVHRVGRTARAGRQGTAITFVTPSEYRRLLDIQRHSGTRISKENLPSNDDIIRRREERLGEAITAIIAEGRHCEFLSVAENMLKDNDPAALIAALLKINAKGVRRHSRTADIDANETGTDARPAARRDRDNADGVPRLKRRAEHPEGDRAAIDRKGKAKLFVAIGKSQGATPKRILELVVNKTGIQGVRPKDIACFDTFSLMTVPFGMAENIVDAFKSMESGHPPLIEMAQETNDGTRRERERKPQRRGAIKPPTRSAEKERRPQGRFRGR